MSEQELSRLTERMAADPGFAALMASEPEAALRGADLTDDERRRILELGADVAGGAVRLAHRLSRSGLVFGSLGHGLEHVGAADPGIAGHEPGLAVGAHHLPPEAQPAHDIAAVPAHGPVNIYEGTPGRWALPEHSAAGDVGAAPPASPWEPSAHPGAPPMSFHAEAAQTPPLAGLEPAPHDAWTAAWSQPSVTGHAQSSVWELPGAELAPTAAEAPDPPVIGDLTAGLERIPGLGEVVSAGVAVGERGHSIPADVLDTFTSLGNSVVSSMSMAITTSVGDGIGVGEGAVQRIRW